MVSEPVSADLPEGGDVESWVRSGRRVIYLLDAARASDRRILEQWVRRQREATTEVQPALAIVLDPKRSGGDSAARSPLAGCLATDDDPLLVPLRAVWLVPEEARHTGLLRLLLLGDPYEPGRLRRWWLRRYAPDRERVIVGEPARLSELRQRWHRLGGTDRAETSGLDDFVARQAGLALDRAERRIRGMRYKVPRFVAQDILSRASFRGGITRLAWESGRDQAEVTRDAERYLGEIAATHSPYVIDVTAQLAHAFYTRGYSERLNYDRDELERVYRLAQRHPVVFLPSHKSNLDHLVLRYALYENGHPPNNTDGGINMYFMTIGPLMRRSGVFFIRRTFKDNAVYKFVLGQYVDFLIEKRFPLEWYIEGGRSRSGKLLAPRFGLLACVVDAYRRGKSEDVILLPVSIAYDQIQDVASYVTEQRGGEKQRESFRWLINLLRVLKRRYGEIYIRFGEPMSLRDALGAGQGDATEADERSIGLQKLAFEVSARINRATPITATSLVTLALLGAGDRALTVDDTIQAVAALLDYVHKRGLPTTEAIELDEPAAVLAVLSALVESDIVTSYSGGPDVVYAIGADQHLAAAYYRNAVIHFFVNAAIVELALLGAAAGDGDTTELFWAEAGNLRDLLKFEFFFAGRERFRAELESELSLHEPQWQAALAGGREPIRELLRRLRPLTSYLVIRPFIEAYRVVGDVLLSYGPSPLPPEPELLRRCLGLGKQYHLQKRIRSAESVSNVFFANGLRLAANRGLLQGEGEEVVARRTAFAAELREAIRRMDAIEAMAAGRRTGLLD